MERPRFDSGTVWQFAIRRAKWAYFALSISLTAVKTEWTKGADPRQEYFFFCPISKGSEPIRSHFGEDQYILQTRALTRSSDVENAKCSGTKLRKLQRKTTYTNIVTVRLVFRNGFHGTTRVKVRSSLCRTSPESKMFVSITYRPHVPNFIQIGKKMCKVPIEII